MSKLQTAGPKILQNAAAATADGSTLIISGYRQVVFQITGTFVATVTWEAKVVDAATWVAVAVADLSSTTRARATTATTTGLFLLDDAAGISEVRARVSAFTSGSVTVTAQASA